MHDGIEQGNGGDGSLTQRQDHIPQDLKIIGSVKPRRFRQLKGNGLEEGTHNDHVVNLHGIGDHHGPDGIVQPQLLHQQEGRNGAAAEKHGKGKEHGNGFSEGHFGTGQGICRQDRQDYVDQRTQGGVKNGILQALQHLAVMDNGFIGIQTELYRPKGHISPGKRVIAGKGDGKDIQDRRNDTDQNHRAHDKEKKIKHLGRKRTVFNHA